MARLGTLQLGWHGELDISLYISCMLCEFCNFLLWESSPSPIAHPGLCQTAQRGHSKDADFDGEEGLFMMQKASHKCKCQHVGALCAT